MTDTLSRSLIPILINTCVPAPTRASTSGYAVSASHEYVADEEHSQSADSPVATFAMLLNLKSPRKIISAGSEFSAASPAEMESSPLLLPLHLAVCVSVVVFIVIVVICFFWIWCCGWSRCWQRFRSRGRGIFHLCFRLFWNFCNFRGFCLRSSSYSAASSVSACCCSLYSLLCLLRLHGFL